VETFESITLGVINLLEALRFLGTKTRIYNACSSECFGDTGGKPANEATPFHPRSPYATAKAAAYWALANYREAYNLHACSGILFNHESPLRPGRFVTRKIISAACAIAKSGKGVLELGNVTACRDWGWAPEYVDAMWRMVQLDVPCDLVIATGESHSIEEFCKAAFEELNLDYDKHVVSTEALFRPSEIQFGKGDASLAAQKLGWRARYKMRDVIRAMIKAELNGEGQIA
jgi:GDPmannose 4,6-dehydratase